MKRDGSENLSAWERRREDDPLRGHEEGKVGEGRVDGGCCQAKRESCL